MVGDGKSNEDISCFLANRFSAVSASSSHLARVITRCNADLQCSRAFVVAKAVKFILNKLYQFG